MATGNALAIEQMRDLLKTFTDQLLAGCGNTQCKNQYCATGRKQTSHAPVRPYTARSARSIALAVLGESNPRSHLCRSQDAATPIASSKTANDEGHDRKDPSSFMQKVGDTSRLRQWTEDSEPGHEKLGLEVPMTLQLATKCIKELERHTQPPYLQSGRVNPGFTSHAQAVQCVSSALHILYSILPDNRHQGHWKLVAKVINDGNAVPQANLPPHNNRAWIALLDYYNYEPWLNICALVCKITALRTQLDDIAVKLRLENLDLTPGETPFIDQLAPHFQNIAKSQAGPGDSWIPWPYPLWLKKVFATHWDGNPVVKRGTAECGALELLGCLQRIYDALHESKKNDAQILPGVWKRVGTQAMAETWMQHQPGITTTTRHLLSCRYLFPPSQMVLHWRMINHLTMRQAYSVSQVHDELYGKALAHYRLAMTVADQHYDSLQRLRDYYLLLSVSREDVVKDAFDQLWQRKKSDLLRPLRVRLGEMDGMEVGHDLGGVQIEFFNLICEKLFAEDAGMFITDPTTSLSYFRPGSLQPLYMFELFGVLVSLAIYNGITIPVSFPLALYAQLLDRPCESFTLNELKDGWPAIARSLQVIHEGGVPDTEWVLPMEANGVQFSVGKKAFTRIVREAKEYEHGFLERITLPYSDLTVLGGRRASQTEKLSPPRKHWPGWSLTADPTGTIHPVLVPGATTTHYIRSYIAWLTTYSVHPQLQAFKRGFHTLLPDCARPLFTPQTLKTIVEGTTTLDLAALRRSTHYDGYTHNDPYIQVFWKILEGWKPEEQKALLRFVTAAERIPVTGAGSLTFRVCKAVGVGNEQLPTSSTCFGTLYLPRYKTPEMLETRLRTAVEFGGVGFGNG